MVDHTLELNSIFGSLADPTRRDILRRVAGQELSVNAIAAHYGNLTLAAISKHLKVLENAKLVVKRRDGKQQFVSAHPATLREAAEYLNHYEKLWNQRFDSLAEFLKQEN